MCLQAQGSDDNNGGVGGVIPADILSDNGGGVGRGRGIDDASERSETMAEAVGARQRAQGIYDNN